MATEKELRDLNKNVYKVDTDFKDSGNKTKLTDKSDGNLGKNEKTEEKFMKENPHLFTIYKRSIHYSPPQSMK